MGRAFAVRAVRGFYMVSAVASLAAAVFAVDAGTAGETPLSVAAGAALGWIALMRGAIEKARGR